MYRRPRKKVHLGWLVTILALVLLAGIGYGVYQLIVGTPELDSNAFLLPTPNKDGVYPWSNGVLSVYDNKLICNELNRDAPLWTIDLPANNMKARKEGDYAVAWGGNNTVLIDKDGISRGVKAEPEGTEVVLAVPGASTFAVIIREEGQHRLRVYSAKDLSQVDEIRFPYASVLGVGYFGDKASQLWVLTVDSHGTEPVTRLTTYTPGKKYTGEITLRNEIGYAAVLQKDLTYLVGTHTQTVWEHGGETEPRKLVYGWNLQDALVGANGKVTFLFSPAGAAGQLSSLWYVNSDGTEYRFPLPAGCTKAMLKENGRICAVSANGVYSFAANGTSSRFYPLANTVESISAVVPGKAFVIYSNHRNYLMNLP